eukprot:1347830-Lingulodinium_polyedra.AAC.1
MILRHPARRHAAAWSSVLFMGCVVAGVNSEISFDASWASGPRAMCDQSQSDCPDGLLHDCYSDGAHGR